MDPIFAPYNFKCLVAYMKGYVRMSAAVGASMMGWLGKGAHF